MYQPPILKTNEWGARPPKHPIERAGRPHEILIHGTDGHHPEISNPNNESVAEAIRYAKAIQHLHMDIRGWSDSGHNFLVCRNGFILVGRHQSYTAIKAGGMVVSAHCPGHNEQPGIEFEHLGEENLTRVQLMRGIELIAWICHCTRMQPNLKPHHAYFPTACPTKSIDKDISHMQAEANRLLKH